MKLDLVNIKQGTDSQRRFSNGNTLPLTALPHALAMFAPQTDGYMQTGWFYHPDSHFVEGIRLTHQPSPWIGDFSYLTFMPQSEKPFVSADSRWSSLDTGSAVLRPDYLSVRFSRYDAEISLAPTDTGAVIKVDYDARVNIPRFAITPEDFDGEITIDEKTGEIYGFTTSKNGRPQKEFRCYYIFKFDCGISDVYVTDGEKAHRGKTYVGNAAGANVALSSKHAEIRLATSYISVKQARLNMEREAYTFTSAREYAAKTWESLLNKIEVTGEEDKVKTFYSCMYRAFLFPTKLYELDEDGNPMHVNPETGEIKNGVMYTNNGFWDTYRTVYPLYSLIIPEKCNEIIKGWLNFFDDTGYLPRWPSPSEAGCMPGTLIEAVLADAVVKGILDKADCVRALTAMLKNAEVPSGNNAQGRKCVDEYAALGYVPYDKCYESVNETLDCAYGDFCIAQVASYLGEKQIADSYYARSKNYKNIFDSSVGFMRAKDSNGNFRPDFDSFAWGLDYTEGSAWQCSEAVQHDVEGLASLHGGKEKFLAYIDRLFDTPPIYHIGGYGGEIHEMSEMAAAPFGQCAISNQPSFHIPYLYGELGENAKTAAAVRRLAEAFSAADDGFPGDEDNGTTACWYIFSAMGFYPMCPGKPEYVVSEPLFERVVMHLDCDVDVKELLKNKIKVRQSEFCKPLYEK